MVGVGARGNTALQLKESMGLTKYASENGNSDSVIGSLIQSMKVHLIKTAITECYCKRFFFLVFRVMEISLWKLLISFT